MSDYITALTGAGTAMAVGLTSMARALPVRPKGRHRAPRPAVQSVLNEVSLNELLDGGEVECNGFEFCPAEQRTTFHAIRRDGSRRCWTCSCESQGDQR